MRRYRIFPTAVWTDPRFSRVSPMPPSAQTLYLYLRLGPHTTQLPGLYQVGRAALQEALAWPAPAFDRAAAELEDAALILADWRARVVWIPDVIADDPPRNPNIVLGWSDTFDLVPSCRLRALAWQTWRGALEDLDAERARRIAAMPKSKRRAPTQTYLAAFYHALGTEDPAAEESFPEPSRESFPEPSRESFPVSGAGAGTGTASDGSLTGIEAIPVKEPRAANITTRQSGTKKPNAEDAALIADLVDQILAATNDEKSRAFFAIVARHVPETLVYAAISEVRAAINEKRLVPGYAGAYFTTVITAKLEDAGLAIPWRRSGSAKARRSS